jgi:cyclopropane fatty-acyl-phospholipid synthase-like methyltransferase
MDEAPSDHRVWQSIDYRPAMAAPVPEILLPHLAPGHTALDIGCNTGNTALWLARHGISVTGIDINADALETSRTDAVRAGLQAIADFKLADIARDVVAGPFDAVLLIRVLTCFPPADEWNIVLHRVRDLLRVGGLLYVHDFLRDDDIAHYRQRYHEAEQRGWRPGNFNVNDPSGKVLFVAHHHTQVELEQIMEPYTRLDLSCHISRSLNGNECRMFRFLGRKR